MPRELTWPTRVRQLKYGFNTAGMKLLIPGYSAPLGSEALHMLDDFLANGVT